MTTEEQTRPKDLERENRELRRANEILRKASASYAQAELDRRGSVATPASLLLPFVSKILPSRYSPRQRNAC